MPENGNERVKGSQVYNSPKEAKAFGVTGKIITGIVRGFGHDPYIVRVEHPPGSSKIESWHMDFWEPFT